MRNIKLTIEYDGTDYCGWQVQRTEDRSQKTKNRKQKTEDRKRKTEVRTIQGEIQKAIKQITGQKANLYGSGRTDSGVHAKGQVANFHTSNGLKPEKIQKALNAVLPKAISVTKTEEIDGDFHSRFSVKSKIYRYVIHERNVPSPFLNRYCLFIPYKLNFALMKKEARVLCGRHNFQSFESSGRALSKIRNIKKISLRRCDDLVIIDIEANGFLYNMVRNIVGTLIEIGRGKFSPGSMKKILSAKDRTKAGPTAPARGLRLMKVKY